MNFPPRPTMMVLAAILLLALIAFGVNQCSKRKSEAAQARVSASQAEAQSDSARDAITTVARSGEETAASEQLTRDSERAIRAAPGADARVDMGVHSAGLAALCKRAAYKDAPRCAPFQPK